ncbi:MAG TPA: serine/threonine-protein kinase, partial [Kofleriaceae bacterium]
MLANYELLDQVGAGGMATVNRARQRGIGGFDRIVALKRIHPQLAAREEFTDRFVREARIVSALAHANIVQVYEFGGDYLAMEYLEGWSLLRILSAASAAGSVTPLPVILSLLYELCDALDHVHTRCGIDGEPLQIVHRDLSLGNLFVARSGHLKLIDFGVATAPGLVPSDDGRICGKPSYMAPEVIRGRPSDARADVFAVGVLAWELLAGQRLFMGDDDGATMREVLTTPVVRPSQFRDDCPPLLDSLVLAAVTKNPAKRSSSAAVVREQLLAVMRVGEIEVGTAVVTRWLAEVMVPAPARRPSTPVAWETMPSPVVVRALPTQIAWRPALAVAAAIAIAPLILATRGHASTTAAAMPSITMVQSPPAHRIVRIDPMQSPLVATREMVVPVVSSRTTTARAVAIPTRSSPPPLPIAPARVQELPPVEPQPVEPVHAAAPVISPPIAEALLVAKPRLGPSVGWASAVRSGASSGRGRAGDLFGLGPMTIPPDRVKQLSGAIERVDRRRLDRDGGPS